MSIAHRRALRPATAIVWLSVLAISCAPQAEPIRGDIETVLRKGLDNGTEGFEHATWDEILREYVREEGRKFDYVGLKADEQRLDAYLTRLADADLSQLSADHLFALFVNAYNAYTVNTVLGEVSAEGAYQIESIRDIPDVFDRKEHIVGGFELSLNNIEHNILRPLFKDPRVHFAVNCASTSCPPLPVRAFSGATVDEQLQQAAGRVLGSPDYVRVEDDRLLVTRILDWYGSDFVNEEFFGAEEDLPSYIEKYASDDIRDWIRAQAGPPEVDFMDYDWSLNRVEAE